MVDVIEVAFAAAHEAALLASADLIQRLGRTAIYPGAPPTGEKPDYVIFEAPEVNDDSTGCVDGWEIHSSTKVWGRTQARALAIAGLCRRILNVELSIPGYRVVDFLHVSSSPGSQPDGSTRVVVIHRYLVEAA